MDVSIIFVNYKTKDLTINAIKSVIDKTAKINYEIIVVDNNSQDCSIEAIEKEFPNINIIKNSVNSGFGSANNIGIKQAKGKYVFCLNTDTLLINNPIKIMFDFMEKEENQKVAVCGGYLFDGDDNACTCGGKFPSLMQIIWKFGLRKIFKEQYKNYSLTLNSNDIPYINNIDYITGANMFIRKSVLDEVGLFDENIFMYFEETDLCYRIKKFGYDVKFVQEAKIQHLEGKSCSNILAKKQISKKSEFYFFKKHHPHQVWLVKLIYSMLYLIDWLILKNKDSKELLRLVLNG